MKNAIQNAIRVACTAQIRRNDTGETRLHSTELFIFEGDTEIHTFNWREGNNSCDCNRYLYFERAGGNDVKWDDEGATCSDGLYSVNLYRVSDGQCFYSEFETDPTKTF